MRTHPHDCVDAMEQGRLDGRAKNTKTLQRRVEVLDQNARTRNVPRAVAFSQRHVRVDDFGGLNEDGPATLHALSHRRGATLIIEYLVSGLQLVVPATVLRLGWSSARRAS